MKRGALAVVILILFVSLSTLAASAQVTRRASLGPGGSEGNGPSAYASISADGRWVGFFSAASNLVSGDSNGQGDVFVLDRLTGATERVSVGPAGAQADGPSISPSISSDGRFVAFWSTATNLVPGDTNGAADVFVRDRVAGTTERASVGSGGTQGNAASDTPSISADGRHVAFRSEASNLVPGDTNGAADVFVRDLQAATTVRVSVGPGGAQGNGASDAPSISAGGAFVSFFSTATNLVAGDTNGVDDIFVRDSPAGVTERVSVGPSGAQSDGHSQWNSISGDGRWVAFESLATNLVPGDSNSRWDVFVRDRQSGTTERASVSTAGAEADGNSFYPSLSLEGRTVAFESFATNLVTGDTNGAADVFTRHLERGTTTRASLASSGAQGNSHSEGAAISLEGRFVAFSSLASNLVPGDSNGLGDVFVRDRRAAGFRTICEPGAGGVIACPCANAPSGPGRGCDNSSATGGAVLSASGAAYLSGDDLVFTAFDAMPSALSITWQGRTEIAAGVAYGQGVRCAGGALKRLYLKTTSGGRVTAPDLAGGDLPVSARSAVVGDPIQPGEARFYFVHYRDPVVLGGCTSTWKFNATLTGRVDWSL